MVVVLLDLLFSKLMMPLFRSPLLILIWNRQVYDIQADGNQAKVLQASLKEGSKTEYESLVGTASV